MLSENKQCFLIILIVGVTTILLYVCLVRRSVTTKHACFGHMETGFAFV